MAIEYYTELLKSSFGINAQRVKLTPLKAGDYTLKKEVSVTGAPHTYKMNFYVGGDCARLLEISLDIPASSSGVGARELFRILVQQLRGQEATFANLIDGSVTFTTEKDYLVELFQKISQERQKILAMDLQSFGEYIQKRFKRAISFQGKHVEGLSHQTLICPWLEGQTLSFTGCSETKETAKWQALQQALMAFAKTIQ